MSKQTVVIIEMEPPIADAYELFLSTRNYHVATASSLGTGLREVASRRPQVVVIGNLPDSVDGATVAERVRAMMSPSSVGVIVLAASMDEIPAADLVVPRGAHPRAVMDAIRTVSRRRQVTAPLATAS